MVNESFCNSDLKHFLGYSLEFWRM